MIPLIGTIILAVFFWSLLFFFRPFNFWMLMFIATGVLGFSGLWLQRKKLKELFPLDPGQVILGVVSALVLYAVFFAGNIVSGYLFPFAEAQVSNVYATKTGVSTTLVGVLLVLWIGPLEEIFWRGYVQDKLSGKYGRTAAFFIALFFYTAVHIWSMNFMLIMAAMVAGAFWGVMFWYKRSLTACLISHALWDCLIFIVFPIS